MGHSVPGVMNTVDWPSRLGFGRQSDNLSLQKRFGNLNCGLETGRLRGIDLRSGKVLMT